MVEIVLLEYQSLYVVFFCRIESVLKFKPSPSHHHGSRAGRNRKQHGGRKAACHNTHTFFTEEGDNTEPKLTKTFQKVTFYK